METKNILKLLYFNITSLSSQISFQVLTMNLNYMGVGTSFTGAEHEKRVMDLQLQGEVMACAYEDVQVMWSILDKSKSIACDINP